MTNINHTNEIWKDPPKELLLSKYQVSDLGRIKNKLTGYILTQIPNRVGYISNYLRFDNGIKKTILVHRLVCFTFLENPNTLPTVNHINQIKHDNRLVNLEWASSSHQNLWVNKNQFKTRSKSVNQYDLNGTFIKTWKKIKDAANEFGINETNISSAAKGKRKTAGGFVWKYYIEHIDNEVWKECPLGTDYNKVLVSNFGRIKTNKKAPTYGTLISQGYYIIQIFNITKQKYKGMKVHRLVCLAFLDNPENKAIVNHKDEIRSNNKLENLEWVTHIENMNHSLDLNNRISKNKRSKIVVQINPTTNNIINEFVSISMASKETNVHSSSIGACCRNLKGYKTAGGFKWKFKDELE
jgi:hypothetical protein